MKAWSIVLLASVVLLIVPGCWGRSELKDVAIVTGVGIDQKGNKYEVTTETLKLGPEQQTKIVSAIVRSAMGTTIFEAIRDLIITLGKRQVWQHVDAFIIGEKTAESGITPVTDFMLRDHEPRFRMNILIAKGTAKDILSMKPEAGKVNGTLIKNALEEQSSLSKAPQVQLYQFGQMFIERYQDPYIPMVRKGKQGFEIYGTAIFKRDKMVGQLTPNETRGLLRVLGKLNGGIQVLKLNTKGSTKPAYISIEIKKSKAGMKVKFEHRTPKIEVNIQETGFIGDISHPINHQQIDQKLLNRIEKLYADSIKKEAEQVIAKIQKKYKSNALGFAGLINRADKRYWQQHKDEWEDLYPRIKVVVNVKTNIPENGLIRDNVGY
ncbi:Ger(x)C family spore germination protein [Ferviditalea candida]|uniref:Ger(X)C family spore germination protein n=1 Tax=Ferviditalea candida TaxID=3108399 RepID=A0ABU5ZJ95_9BACL|nr:Ger(x)C family spore germination protein [Paenibacillaceae bacterium T2]